MRIINISTTDGQIGVTIPIGKQGENEATRVDFDVSPLIETFGEGVATLTAKRNGDDSAYPVVITRNGNKASWVVTNTDTAYTGRGQCELIWTINEQIAKSIVWSTRCDQSINSSDTPPDPYESWIDTLVELGSETEANAQRAEDAADDAVDAKNDAVEAKNRAVQAEETAAGAKDDAILAKQAAEAAAETAETAVTHYPKIQDNYWYVWQNGGWVNTGVKAEGVDGVSITDVSCEKTSTSGLTDTYTMTVTYSSGSPDTFTFTVTNGEDGYNPVVTIATITGGHRITITDKDHPSGQSFDVMDGADGITPTVSVTSISGGHNVAFDYGSGDPRNTDFDVMDGEVSSADLQAVADAKAPVIIDHAEGSIVSVVDGADGMPLKECVVGIEPVQSGSGDPSPDNVRPITGWTGANVVRTGKNLIEESTAPIYNRYFTDSAWRYSADSRSFMIPCRPNTHYTISANCDTTIFRAAYLKGVVDPSSQTSYSIYGLSKYTDTTIPIYINTDSEATYIAVQFGQTVMNNRETKIQIEYGSTATAYEVGHVSSLSIPFGTTVYGGSLDVNTGVLTVDKVSVDMGSLSWNLYNSTFYVVISDKADAVGDVRNIMCSILTPKTAYNSMTPPYDDGSIWEYSNSSDLKRVCAFDSDYSTKEAFKTGMSGQQLVYNLATPLTYQLTASQLTTLKLTTLKGINNIWADTGDTSVDYCCDTKLFIEKLTMPTEDDMVANTNIASGTFFMVGNNLYYSTASIASGDAIVVGTNCNKLSLADALNNLNT